MTFSAAAAAAAAGVQSRVSGREHRSRVSQVTPR